MVGTNGGVDRAGNKVKLSPGEIWRGPAREYSSNERGLVLRCLCELKLHLARRRALGLSLAVDFLDQCQ